MIQPTHATNSNFFIVMGIIVVALVMFLIGGIVLAVVFSAPASPTPLAQATPVPSVLALGPTAIPTASASTVLPTNPPQPSTSTPVPAPTATPTSVATSTSAPTSVPPTATPVPPTATPTPSPTPNAADAVKRALAALVKIQVPVEGTKLASLGSGSVVDPRGYVLTNRHVVRDADTGKRFNSQDLIYICVMVSVDKEPDCIYRAQVAQLDDTLDLALLRIVARADGGKIPDPLALATIPLGNSDSVQIGDEIQVIGFPSLGGDTLTLTRGIVSGFVENRTWIKTDTEINPGNSGGMTINRAGELIGVPSIVMSGKQVTGKIGYVRPINLARPLIATAK